MSRAPVGWRLGLFTSNYRSQEALLWHQLTSSMVRRISHLSEASQRDHLEMRPALTGSYTEGRGVAGPFVIRQPELEGSLRFKLRI